ncbi:MAG: phenylalanine--tRNA ligase subunit alpha [Mycoplasma sp.]|nr:phenylalanine--tRNA ligase subunit alpha [Mycoplasma sp.]
MELKEILKNIKSLEELKIEKHNYFGPNSKIAKLKNELKNSTSVEEKKRLGFQLHNLLKEGEELFEQAYDDLYKKNIEDKIKNEFIDLTEPNTIYGTYHPITLVIKRFKEFLMNRSFYEVKGSIVVNELWNFDKLNMPKNHPSREMQDSLFIDKDWLLRTHNTSTTIKELNNKSNKEFGCFAIGPVFRNDDDDLTHSHQFHQIDFIATGKDMNFAKLLTFLKDMLEYVFEKKLELRFRPSYFPFTEPSVEVDIFENNKWIEILGAGLFNPEVMSKAKFNTDFDCMAGGIGLDRIAMIKYKIKDIRFLYKNDFRFLNQFKDID